MCGIIGYLGPRNAADVLLEGLARLEYRGYDSAGVAVLSGDKFIVRRRKGKLAELARSLRDDPVQGQLGIGHTRWATHGRPSEENAHPHRAGSVLLVHNGIIENHVELRDELKAQGHIMASETDSEIVAHLIWQKRTEGLDHRPAVSAAISRLHGAYAFLVAFIDLPSAFFATRSGSPLIVGYGEHEMFVASDVPALLPFTKKVDFLLEGELAEITADGCTVYGPDNQIVSRPPRIVPWGPIAAEKDGHKHFMHKEIHEQPRALIHTLQERIDLATGDIYLDGVDADGFLEGIDKIFFLACGTAYHACLLGKLAIENLAGVPAETDLASEFRYRHPILNERTLCVLVSQSGETADTLAALREAKAQGAKTLAVCNSIESTITREADRVIYTVAGPEIGVASTKAFVTQLAVLIMFAVYLGRRTGRLSVEHSREALTALVRSPVQCETVLAYEEQIRQFAREAMHRKCFLFIGRGPSFPIALEGALKLKEISYLHAEGYAAGEMKHGPIALVDENMLVTALIPDGPLYEKMLANVAEVRAREGKVLAIATAGNEGIRKHADAVFYIPASHPLVEPILQIVPLQLLAYHIADLSGTDVDQPRNLAKSVTVE